MAPRLIWISGAILVLNLVVAWASGWAWPCLFFSLGLLMSFFPLVRFLEKDDGEIPFFPAVSAVYGIDYCLFGIIPFEPYYTVADVSDQAMGLVSLYSCLGIACMLFGYYLTRKPMERISSNLDMRFSERSAKIMIFLGLVSSVAWMAKFVWKAPLAFEAMLSLVSEPLIFVFAALFYMQLQGRIPRWMVGVNWAGFAPLVLVTSLATSLLYPLIRLLLLAFLVYLTVHRRFPWRQVTLIGSVLMFLFVLKTEFRRLEVATNKEKIAGLQQFNQRLRVYKDVLPIVAATPGSEILQANLNTVASRLDMSHLFAFIVDHAPSRVPYMNGRTYQGLAWKFVPRFLYSEKPTENLGNELGHDLGWLGPEDDDTSVNMPQMIELYLNFGLLGVPLGMLIIGGIYAWILNLLCSEGTQVQQVIALFMTSSLFNIESNFSIVFGGVIYLFVFIPVLLHALLRSTVETEDLVASPVGEP